LIILSKHKKRDLKTVSIIIPFYGQSESDLAIPLSSINNQVGVDFSKIDVHLVNDGGPAIDLKKFDIFKHLDLHYHELAENVGPGMARQYGIDHSEGQYLMFVDSDDQLSSLGALREFFQAIEQSGQHDVISSAFLEMSFLNQEYKVYQHPAISDLAFKRVYAKWFSRKYLEKINLRFLPEISYLYEDMYFAFLALKMTSDIHVLNFFSYVRIAREGSLSGAYEISSPQNAEHFIKDIKLRLEKIYEVKPAHLVWEDERIGGMIDLYVFYDRYKDDLDKAAYRKEVGALCQDFHFDLDKELPRLQMIAGLWEQHHHRQMDMDELTAFFREL